MDYVGGEMGAGLIIVQKNSESAGDG